MSERQDKTLLAKLGFGDGETATAEHDELMLWADANAEDVLRPIVEQRVSAASAADWVHRHWKNHPGEGELVIPPPPDDLSAGEVSVKDRVWEYVVSTRTGFTVGFIDLLLRGRVRCHALHLSSAGTSHQWQPDWETLRWEWHSEPVDVCVEVKSHIKSAGELLRQLRLYQQHMGRDYDFVVVSPDDRFDDVIRSQGFHIVRPGAS